MALYQAPKQRTNNLQIKATAHFANDLGLDSLDTVEVVMAIEEEFSIEIPDKDADSIHSGRPLINCCQFLANHKPHSRQGR